MNTLFYKVKISLLMAVCVQFIACQHQFELTPQQPSEAALVANSAENGMEAILEIDYLQTYQNLKIAYSQCVAFTSNEAFVFTDSKLEEHLEMGTIFARTKGGAFLSKVLVESLEPNKTKLTFFISKNYLYAESRFRQEIKRAKGLDAQCNDVKIR